MQKSQSGFTLVELVVVIVLLGILGVTALGKFEDLSLDAQNAANSGIAGELSAASSINYAARVLDPVAGGIPVSGNPLACSTLGGLFASGSLPAGYTFGGSGDCSTPGNTISCTVDNTANLADTPASATVICTTP